MRIGMLLFGLTGALVAGCGGSSKKDEDAIVPIRKGEIVKPVDKKYDDSEPSLDDAGAKVVFRSGRDGNNALKIYKFDTTSAEPQAARATDADLGSEYFSALSPNGEWLVVLAADGASSKAYIQSFADVSLRTEIDFGEDVFFPDYATFNRDATPLLVVSGLNNVGESKIYVVAFTATNGAPAVTSVTPVGDVAAAELRPQWVGTGVPYQLVTSVRGVGGINFITRQFNDATLSGLTRTEQLTTPIAGAENEQFTASSQNIFFRGKVASGTGPVVPQGDKPEDEKGKVYRQWEARYLPAGQTVATAILTTQHQVDGVAANHEGDVALLKGDELFFCKFRDVSGSTLVFWDASTQTTSQIFFKYDGSAWSLATDLCANFPETLAAEEKPIDMQIRKVELARQITNGRYIVAYQTGYSGDNEVMLVAMDYAAGVFSNAVFTKISNNSPSTEAPAP